MANERAYSLRRVDVLYYSSYTYLLNISKDLQSQHISSRNTFDLQLNTIKWNHKLIYSRNINPRPTYHWFSSLMQCMTKLEQKIVNFALPYAKFISIIKFLYLELKLESSPKKKYLCTFFQIQTIKLSYQQRSLYNTQVNVVFKGFKVILIIPMYIQFLGFKVLRTLKLNMIKHKKNNQE